MHQKNDLKKAISDVKIITASYQEKDMRSALLLEKLKSLEMELLDQFYTLSTKPAGRKASAKKTINKVINAKKTPKTTEKEAPDRSSCSIIKLLFWGLAIK